MSNETTLRIHRASPSDAPILAVLGARTFAEAFGHLYPPQDLHSFLELNHSEASWARLLCDRACAIWWAELDTWPVGYILVGACTLPIDALESTAGEIKRLYVLAEHHNHRLGSQLLVRGLEWLAAQGRAPIYLGVWSQNHSAQRFYSRYGFSKVGEYDFPVGTRVDREYIFKR